MCEKRLIDANALMEQLSRKTSKVAQLRFAEGFNDAIMRVRSMIHSAPTIDAVEVVRCKYCMNATKLCDGLPTGKVACLRLLAEMPDDGFCHNGAKMDAKEE